MDCIIALLGALSFGDTCFFLGGYKIKGFDFHAIEFGLVAYRV